MRLRLVRLRATVHRSSAWRLGGMEDGGSPGCVCAPRPPVSDTEVVARRFGPGGPGGPSTKMSLPHRRHFVRMRFPRTFSSGTAYRVPHFSQANCIYRRRLRTPADCSTRPTTAGSRSSHHAVFAYRGEVAYIPAVDVEGPALQSLVRSARKQIRARMQALRAAIPATSRARRNEEIMARLRAL